ncbi:MAG TPA: 30S ribosomal protein S16 [Micromonosporaceae bacterium]|nr:30S ribosomal protein S16 [Micromonosporaceae bacterium]
MAVRIRLLRMGKIHNPQYRIVVADSRTKRDGRAIEFLGIYQPKEDPSVIEVKSDRVQHWLSVGAQPSDAVQRLLEKTGDWQKFKGLPAPEPLKMAPERANRTAVYEAEAKAAAGLAETPAKPAKKAAAKKAAPAADTTSGSAETPAETPAKTEEQAGADSGEQQS